MEEKKKKSWNKDQVLNEAKNIGLVLLGCLVLALADELFIVPCSIVNGGVDSLGVIINHMISPYVTFDWTDIIIIAIAQAILWIVGCFTLGKKFSLRTLLGSLAFPLFYALMFRLRLRERIGLETLFAQNHDAEGNPSLALLLLSAIFGGALSGAGVALAYTGNGSTGGFDVVSFLIAKYSDIKEDVSGFILDSSLIVFGLIVFQDWQLALAGILSAFCCAFAVQYVYVYSNSFIIADIISDHTDEIIAYADKELGHGSTLINVTGGHSGEKRKLIRVAVFRVEMSELRSFIATIDPKAFIIFSNAKTVNGKGFDPLLISGRKKKHILSQYVHEDTTGKEEAH
jgi:uncharacterized membrane-anchored protein YitT (DUF2179 family)